MANFHDHTCPACLTVWTHDLWDCRIRDGSPEAQCPQCVAALMEIAKGRGTEGKK